MEKIKKIVNVIYNIIIYGLIIIILFYLCIIGYNKVFKKESLPSINNYYLFQIASGSMENKLKSGDYIIVKKTNKYKIIFWSCLRESVVLKYHELLG